MSNKHQSILRNSEAKFLAGYVVALSVVLTDVSHGTSSTIETIEGWQKEAQDKYNDLVGIGQPEPAPAVDPVAAVDTPPETNPITPAEAAA